MTRPLQRLGYGFYHFQDVAPSRLFSPLSTTMSSSVQCSSSSHKIYNNLRLHYVKCYTHTFFLLFFFFFFLQIQMIVKTHGITSVQKMAGKSHKTMQKKYRFFFWQWKASQNNKKEKKILGIKKGMIHLEVIIFAFKKFKHPPPVSVNGKKNEVKNGWNTRPKDRVYDHARVGDEYPAAQHDDTPLHRLKFHTERRKKKIFL